MIRSFEILDPKAMHIPWLADVPALSKPRKFEFKPGLNVLWGKNGSGKTTLIKALARLFHCEQSGNPVLNENSIRELFDRYSLGRDKDEKKLPGAFKLDHDGQGVRYFDPSVAVGLMAGGAAFDWDFGAEGIANAMFKGSSGQTTMHRFNKVVESLLERTVPKLDQKMKADRVNDFWGDRIKMALSFLEGSGEQGPPTVLLDEPERSFDLQNQLIVWRFIRSFAPNVQFIIASHTLFALNLKEAHYIEMDEGYLNLSQRCHKLLTTTWCEEDPVPQPPKPSEMPKGKPPAAKRSKKAEAR